MAQCCVCAGQLLEQSSAAAVHWYCQQSLCLQILEWTESAEQAIEYSILLNDKWEIDGRDPNGYVGCMWSMCGVHDQVMACISMP